MADSTNVDLGTHIGASEEDAKQFRLDHHLQIKNQYFIKTLILKS